MASEDNKVLVLPPVTDFDITTTGDLVLDGRVIGPTELKRIAKEAQQQQAAIAAIVAKTKYGLIQLGEIDRTGYVTLYDTVESILNKRNKARSKEHREVMDNFAKQVNQEAANSTLQALRLCKTWILRIIHKSPYPPDLSEPQPKSFWKRIFGS